MNELIQRLRATGDPLCVEAAAAFEEIILARKRRIGVDVSKMTPEHIATFWSRVDRSGGPDACWPWLGVCNHDGYGHTFIKGRTADVRVHRVAAALDGMAQPIGMEADHICNNRPCCNPKHIRFVTPRENKQRSNSPHSLNARKTHCSKCGNEYAGANLAVIPTGKKPGKPRTQGRACLTCYPQYWSYAVVERTRPPGATVKAWRGPYNPDAESR